MQPRAPAAGAWALRIAAVWIAVLAVLVFAFGFLAVWLTFDPPMSEKPDAATAWPRAAAAFGLCALCAALCGLPAIVAWRAVAPGRPIAGVVAFAIGALVLVALLILAMIPLLPPNGLYGLDVYAASSALGLPWSPGALVAVDAAQPACPGRTCVLSAGISFVLPGGWSRAAPESNELYAATEGGARAFLIEDGARALRENGVTVPADLDGIAAQVPALLEGGGHGLWGMQSNTKMSVRRTVLPVGPAVRIAYNTTFCFIDCLYGTTITEWFFVEGRLIVVTGKGTPGDPSSDPPDFTLLVESPEAL